MKAGGHRGRITLALDLAGRLASRPYEASEIIIAQGTLEHIGKNSFYSGDLFFS